MKTMKYKISNAQSGHCVGKYRASDSVGAVKAFITGTGFKLSDFEIETAAPAAEVVLKVSRRGEDPTLIIVRDTQAAYAPISNYPQAAQAAIPGLTC